MIYDMFLYFIYTRWISFLRQLIGSRRDDML